MVVNWVKKGCEYVSEFVYENIFWVNRMWVKLK